MVPNAKSSTFIRVQNSYDPSQASLDRLEEVLSLSGAYSRPENVTVSAMLFNAFVSIYASVDGTLEG
jgi:hypothetical protein